MASSRTQGRHPRAVRSVVVWKGFQIHPSADGFRYSDWVRR
jgi:hypothetical protein